MIRADRSHGDRIEALVRLFDGGLVATLTGAGCSTDSGIPDYRGTLGVLKSRKPVQHSVFVSDASARARYWARSMVGWPRFRHFQPNAAHHAIAQLEHSGRLSGLVTQNVDRLHTKAGSRNLVELHGALADVICLACGAASDRSELQERMSTHNPSFRVDSHEMAPDGDVELPDALVASFRVPDCARCGGVLKPDVVFFGGSVPKATVEAGFDMVDRSCALLVVGSSLAVFSGYRYVRRAVERRIPVALINLGDTRADSVAHVRIHGNATDVLPRIAEALGCSVDVPRPTGSDGVGPDGEPATSAGHPG